MTPDSAHETAAAERPRPAPPTAPKKLVPYAVLAELSHRCPLQCPYCSNPVELERASGECTTDEWRRVMDEASDLGVLHVHFSGGEPTVRRDLEELVAHAAKIGLYSNLITSAVLLDEDRVRQLADSGLDHVQISFQDSTPELGDRIAGYKGAFEKKKKAARLVRKAGLPLTVNAVMHRHNLHHLEDMIRMAVDLDAERIEVAQVQYYAWAYPQPGGIPADARTARRGGAHRGGVARTPEGRAHLRLRRAGLLRAAAEVVHGRLGPAVHQHLAVGQGAAVPRGGGDPRDHLGVSAREIPGGDLGALGQLQPLPRHRLDARAVPELRPPRDRLGRLPLPGLHADRRRGAHGPGRARCRPTAPCSTSR